MFTVCRFVVVNCFVRLTDIAYTLKRVDTGLFQVLENILYTTCIGDLSQNTLGRVITTEYALVTPCDFIVRQGVELVVSNLPPRPGPAPRPTPFPPCSTTLLRRLVHLRSKMTEFIYAGTAHSDSQSVSANYICPLDFGLALAAYTLLS